MIQRIPHPRPATPADRRPTVCHVIHALGVGGAEVLADQMVRRMSDEFRCVIAVLDEIGEVGTRLLQDGFIVEHLQRQPGIDRSCANRLCAFADREKAVILHAHQCTPLFQAMLSRGFTGRRPVVFTEHGRHFPDVPSRRRAFVNRLLLRSQDRLFGCGKAVRQALIDNEGLPADRVEVIYNGVELDVPGRPSSEARARIRAEFGYAAMDFVIVQVARLHELKDHQTALRTIEHARERIPGLRLLVVGDGDQRSAIEQGIRDRGLGNCVTLAGTRCDIADLLAAADAFLLTSISEGIPLTIIEAMVARRPVISTAVGGIPEMIVCGKTGFLAPARDPKALAAALITLYQNLPMRQSMSEAAERRARQLFSLNRMLEDYRSVYRNVLSGSRTTTCSGLPESSMPAVSFRGHRSNSAGINAGALASASCTTADGETSGSQRQIGSLVIFSDDWGRHPSSCQHLTRHLLDRYKVLWVNTIGTRAPRLDLQTAKRVAEKLRHWGSGRWARTSQKSGTTEVPRSSAAQVASIHPNLTVVNPKMWPWFASSRDRRLNRWLLAKQLTRLIQQLPQPVVGLSTLPITADLPDVLPVDRWVYYCVDDFSQWPGLDGDTLRGMDRDFIQRADSIVAASEHLLSMIAHEGRSSILLTHGVDVNFWNVPRCELVDDTTCREKWKSFSGPRIVFWGVIDRRMDSQSIRQLSAELRSGSIVLVGPQQDPDPALLSLPNVFTLPAQPLSVLPQIARLANVLIMPYADLPVTRAMQPLKLKEYLATGKPVVVNRLPSTEAWSDCLDVAGTPAEFSRLVQDRIVTGIPAPQAIARRRLQQEGWASKSQVLDGILNQLVCSCPESLNSRSKRTKVPFQ